ncbi:MAG: DUF1440 domain-containing protein [Vicinamibacterales bacterium]
MARDRHLLGDLMKGAVAGAAATWLMNRTTTWMYEHERDAARQREDDARGGTTGYERAAERAAGAAGVQLSDEQRGRGGLALHWATGIAAGAAYGVLRTRWPAATTAMGLPYGMGVFLAMDEILNPALGLTPGPRAFPWQTHARGLGGHLAFGLTTELVMEGLDRVA